MILLEIEQLFIVLLFVASLIGILVKRLRMPYTVGLVLVGLALAFVRPLFAAVAEEFGTDGSLIPNLILALLVPPLVYEAAFHIQFKELRRELPIVLTLAIPGVVLTTVFVGYLIAWGSGLALPVALVLGAMLAATDPVAVVALFRSLGASRRLQLLLEGESLFNDGTAVVIFSIVLAVAKTGEFSLVESIWEFLKVASGGLIIGSLIGLLISNIINRVDDYLIEISLSLVAAYGSYLAAEHFHFAGVLAVVAAGLITGNIGPRGMSQLTQTRLVEFWEYFAFLANTFVFLVIGLKIDLPSVWRNIPFILLAIVVVLFARAAVIYGVARFFRNLPLRVQHVLFWGGLRGGISLALALSLTFSDLGADLPLVRAMTYGVVLFTLIVQGTTMERLLERLKLIEPD